MKNEMDLDYSELGVSTALAHLGEEDHIRGAVVPPLFQNSLFVFDTLQELWDAATQQPAGPKHHYSRISNPTTELAELKVAHMEGTEACKLFGTGMGAISSVILSCVESGSHVVASDTCYGPGRDFIAKYLSRFGVSHTFIDGRCPEQYFDAIRPETTLVYMESPSSLIFRMQDVEPICRHAHEKGIKTMLDNTYNTPIHFQPARVGVDYVVHSATKYFGGHSDITAGAVCCSAEDADRIVRNEIAFLGATLHPYPAWLLTRGLRTLELRIKRAESTGNTVAEWLEQQAEIDVVHHIGLASYPQRHLVQKYLSGTGGIFSFEPKAQTKEQVHGFVNSLKLFGRGISWGGHESLGIATEVQPSGYTEPRWLVRLYCGLEDPKDLIADLQSAMHHLTPR